MTDTTIQSDSTIETIRNTLSDPEEYVRIVLENMSKCKRSHNNAFVRIGITGTGKLPNHRIDYINTEGKRALFGAFDGRNKFEGVLIHDDGAWSSASMTIIEVQKLLGDIRGYKKR